jgi:methylaspartate mutase epsilon subunit
MDIRNRRLTDDEFKAERKEVLAMWPTGKEIDFDEAVEFQKSLSSRQNYAMRFAEAKRNGDLLIRTDCGVPLVEEQAEYLRYLEDEGKSDALGVIIDSFTRYLKYKEAGEGLSESARTGRWAINGYPIVNHGKEKTRKLIEAAHSALELRMVAPDLRLVLETGLAAGFTAASSDPINAFTNFSTKLRPESVIRNSQYMYRLMGRYEEGGVPIVANISSGGFVLVPYSLTQAGEVIAALFAAEQGVKNILFTVHTQGNLIQDVAACKALPQLCDEYLNRFGYKDVALSVFTTSWSGKFPEDVARAFATICLSVMAAKLGGVQLVHVKTIGEAHTIPRKEDNAASLRAGKQLIDLLKYQRCQLDSEPVEAEMKIQKVEAKAILDRVIELGEGDVVVGAVRAYELGVLDQVFPTSRHVEGKVFGVRDSEGAVRYLDHGSLPFTKEILEFNRQKIAEREKFHGKKVDYESVVDDLFAVSKGALIL